MLTTHPHLRIRRPSPTTAEFIVSTRPPQSISRAVTLVAIYTLRIAIIIAIILAVILARGQNLGSDSALNALTRQALAALQDSPLADSLTKLLAPLSTWVIISSAAALIFLCAQPPRWLLPAAEEESVLVLRGLGMQLQTGGSRKRFIPTEKIRDVLINEAFRGFEVRYYLVVVVEGEEDVVVVFPRLLPGLEVVQKVWRGIRGCLYEQGKSGVLAKEKENG